MERLFLILVVLGLYSGVSVATDDPDTIGDGRWEINSAVTLNSVTGQQAYELPYIEVNYGLGDRFQIKWDSGMEVLVQGAQTQFGWEDSLFGLKWRFVDNSDVGFSVGIFPQVGFRLLSSNNIQLAGPQTYGYFPLEFKKEWGDFSLDAEVGAVWCVNSTQGWMYGLLATYHVTKLTDIEGELHGVVKGTAGTNLLFPPGLIAQVGFSSGFNETVAAVFSVGNAILVSGNQPVTFLLYTGTRFTL